jgi:TetR/AcrR family transcriptional regulator, transcriptional repressor for nem operon
VDVRTGQGMGRAGSSTGGAGRGAAQVPTASRVLDVAERLVQVRGFNGFSYADIAAELHITKASLHYHFATKADLGEALIARYATRFFGALDAADSDGTSAPAKLSAYAKLYADVLSQQRICLCGMLAAEYPTLPPPMQSAVLEFFDHNEAWLQAVLEQGRNEGSLEFPGPARDAARMIISGLEGAMLVTRPYRDAARFQVAADSLLASLTVPASQPALSGPAVPASQPALSGPAVPAG